MKKKLGSKRVGGGGGGRCGWHNIKLQLLWVPKQQKENKKK